MKKITLITLTIAMVIACKANKQPTQELQAQEKPLETKKENAEL